MPATPAELDQLGPLAPRGDPARQPVAGLPEPAEPVESIQFCATELLEALTEIRNRRDQEIAQDHELAWEHDTLPTALIP